jgi:phosphosulfolactate synthase (CoM biosynthesis protein A)
MSSMPFPWENPSSNPLFSVDVDLWKDVLSDVAPERHEKPRRDGHTIATDGGMGERYFHDWLLSSSPYVDGVRFEAGATVLGRASIIRQKIRMANRAGLDVWLDGTLLTAARRQGSVHDVLRRAKNLGFNYAELPVVAPDQTDDRYEAFFRVARELELNLVSSIGLFDSNRVVTPTGVVRQILSDFEHGANAVRLVLTPRSDASGWIGQPCACSREFLLQIGQLMRDTKNVVWAAPTFPIQEMLVELFGGNVNLSDVDPSDSTRLEAVRRGYCAF